MRDVSAWICGERSSAASTRDVDAVRRYRYRVVRSHGLERALTDRAKSETTLVMSRGGNGLDGVGEHLSKDERPIRPIRPVALLPSKTKAKALARRRRARRRGGARDRRLFALALLSVASLCLVVAACLYTSAFRIEGACSLVGDRLCAAARHRMWTAAATAGVAALIGLVAAIDLVRGARGGLRPGPRWPGPGPAA